MRIYRYEGGSEARVALEIEPGRAVDLLEAWKGSYGNVDDALGARLRSTLALIEDPSLWEQACEVARKDGGSSEISLGDVGLLCPLDRAASLRDFLAFEDHVRRGAERRKGPVPDYWYEAPIYYKGNHRTIIGPETECPWPSYARRMDFELELAMIVGRGGRDIELGAAVDHIFGFSILDDFSARDVQAREMTAWLGPAKGKDFATALGPCIVTASELGAEPDLEMICRVNGAEWCRSRSGQMRWRWADMIAHVSQDEAIWPGDVYGSGTPGGCCGLDLGRELEAGDVVELEIEGIGTLRNRIGPRPS